MKTQIKFQKILSLATLIIAALAFVYALCFFSGNLSDLMWYIGSNHDGYFNAADVFLVPAQETLNTIVYASIIFFVVIAFIYITCTNSRRNYYITNYIMTGIVVAYALFIALYGLISVLTMMGTFYNLDWNAINAWYDENAALGAPQVSQSSFMFVLGIIVYVIVLLNALAWVYNLIWKIKLMKGEKELLSKGVVKEGA